jgi:DNA-binding response OmpR family regulator
MTSGALALIVAQPGRLSDGWRALLLATPQIVDVRQVYDTSAVLEIVEALGPDLVLLDAASLDRKGWTVLNQIKDKCAPCCCIVLTCSAQQQRQAWDAGADEVLLKGFSAAQLSSTVERLLPGQEREQ